MKKDLKICNLIIKQRWFDEIMSGKKTKEYREIRPATTDKFCEIDPKTGDSLFDEEKGIFVPRHYDAIRFYVGYNKDRDTALVEVKDSYIQLFVDEDNKPIEYEYKGDWYLASQIVFELGEILEKKVKEK